MSQFYPSNVGALSSKLTMETSELNINELPPEILIKVFRLLDTVNLKKATLTCKLWNNLIESVCRWSVRLWLDGYGLSRLKIQEIQQKVNFMLTTNRKFGTINIFSDRSRKRSEFLAIFQRHGINVVKLVLGDSSIKLNAFTELLNLTPNLTHIDLVDIKIDGPPELTLDEVLPDLHKLKNLRIRAIDVRIVQCFRKAKLTTIISLLFGQSEHCGILVDFLSSQETLTSLTADAQLILIEMDKSSVPIPFQLTHLAIKGSARELSYDHYNSLKFLQSQAKHLTEMEIRWEVPSSVFKCVFAHMTKLDTLGVQVGGLPKDDNFYEHLQINSSVRTLKILAFCGSDDIPYFGNFLKKLPNVRSLSLPPFFNKNVFSMAQNLSNLESLSIGPLKKDSVCYVNFPNLRTLHADRLCDQIDWNRFTRIHPRLTELTIGSVIYESTFTNDDVDQIATNIDLQSIRLGKGFVADDRFFEIIRTKCKNLKVLHLHTSCISRGLSYDTGIDVFRLCNDKQFANDFDNYEPFT